MRVYLVVIDESEEAHNALRFAARRAADTEGAVHLLALVPKQAFNAFGGVQATIEEEARDRAEVMANSAAGELTSDSGLMPQITVKMGDSKAVIDEYLAEHPEVAALVLGAAAEGNPGPLVTHFSGRARWAGRGRDRPVELRMSYADERSGRWGCVAAAGFVLFLLFIAWASYAPTMT
jgi:nucleotide-binding universal stress UspA family protein